MLRGGTGELRGGTGVGRGGTGVGRGSGRGDPPRPGGEKFGIPSIVFLKPGLSASFAAAAWAVSSVNRVLSKAGASAVGATPMLCPQLLQF